MSGFESVPESWGVDGSRGCVDTHGRFSTSDASWYAAGKDGSWRGGYSVLGWTGELRKCEHPQIIPCLHVCAEPPASDLMIAASNLHDTPLPSG